MRFGRFLILTGALLAVAIFILAGCSSDSKPTVSTTDTSTEQSVMEDRAVGLVDSTLTIAGNVLQWYQLASTDPGDPGNPVSYGSINPDSTRNSDLWWIIYDGDLAAGYEYSFIDSVQFRKNGYAQVTPVGADAMSVRNHFTLVATDTTGIFHNYLTEGSYEFAGLTTDQVVIDGASSVTVDARETRTGHSVRSTVVITSVVNDLVIDKGSKGWENGCPVSGTLEASVVLTYQVDDNTAVESTWTITVTFEAGEASIHIMSDNVDVTATRQICSGNPA